MPRRTIVNYAAVNITENLTAKVTSKASSSSLLSSEAFFNFIARSIFFWQSANRQGSINLSGPDGLTGFDGRRRDEMFQTTHLDVWWTVDPINGLKTPAATLKNWSEWNCNSFFVAIGNGFTTWWRSTRGWAWHGRRLEVLISRLISAEFRVPKHLPNFAVLSGSQLASCINHI